jgi:signal peptidase I
MPESSLLAVAAGYQPGRPDGDPSAGLSGDDGGQTVGGQTSADSTVAGPATAGPVIAGRQLARLAVALLARAVLFSILGFLVWAVLPIALGWQPTTVVTGSMVPRIYAGDVVVARPIPTGTAIPGQILLVDDPDHAGRLRLHRYVEATPGGNLILRGDANSTNDSSPVTPEAVHGVAVLRIPWVGLPVVWFTEKNWGSLAAVFVAVSVLVLAAASGPSIPCPTPSPDRVRPGATTHQPGPHQPGSRRRARTRKTARRTRNIQAVLALAALTALASPMMSATAHAGFSAAAPSGASSFSALSSYPCTAFTTPPDGPTFFYRFNEGSGLTAEDASGNERIGTLNRVTLREPGSCRATPSPDLKLGGSPAGYVSASNGAGAASVAAPNLFTLEIWFKAAAGSTAGGRLLGFGNAQTGESSVSDRHLYMTNTGALAFGAAPSPGNSQNYKATAITSAQGYNDGIWHQATATMSASGMKLYVDGVLVTEGNVTAGADTSGYWRVGYDAMSTNSWPGVSGNPVFAGTVDNAAVYPAALTAGQVAAHFNATKSEIRGS